MSITQQQAATVYFGQMSRPTDLGNVGRGAGCSPSPLKPLVKDEHGLDQRRAQSEMIRQLVSGVCTAIDSGQKEVCPWESPDL